MERTNFVSRNVDFSKLRESTALSKYATPSAKNNFLANHTDYLESIVMGKVRRIENEMIPSEINFDLESNRSVLLFGELLRIYIGLGKPASQVSTDWGFDLTDLPDTSYLLKAIYVTDPQSPVIALLPRKAQAPVNEEHRQFQQDMMLNALETIQRTGRVAKSKEEIDFSKNEKLLKRLQNITATYDFSKFKMAKLGGLLEKCLAAADESPEIISILKEHRVEELLNINQLDLPDKHKQMLFQQAPPVLLQQAIPMILPQALQVLPAPAQQLHPVNLPQQDANRMDLESPLRNEPPNQPPNDGRPPKKAKMTTMDHWVEGRKAKKGKGYERRWTKKSEAAWGDEDGYINDDEDEDYYPYNDMEFGRNSQTKAKKGGNQKQFRRK